MTATFTFTGDKNDGLVKIYSDQDCTQLIQSQNQSGTFALAGDSTVPGAKNINYLTVQGKFSYDIYKIESDTLYLGANPGDTPSARSTQLNRDLAFKKVKAD